MNEQKFTQKSIEVIKEAQNLAIEHQNVQIEQEHLLYSSGYLFISSSGHSLLKSSTTFFIVFASL